MAFQAVLSTADKSVNTSYVGIASDTYGAGDWLLGCQLIVTGIPTGGVYLQIQLTDGAVVYMQDFVITVGANIVPTTIVARMLHVALGSNKTITLNVQVYQFTPGPVTIKAGSQIFAQSAGDSPLLQSILQAVQKPLPLP